MWFGRIISKGFLTMLPWHMFPKYPWLIAPSNWWLLSGIQSSKRVQAQTSSKVWGKTLQICPDPPSYLIMCHNEFQSGVIHAQGVVQMMAAYAPHGLALSGLAASTKKTFFLWMVDRIFKWWIFVSATIVHHLKRVKGMTLHSFCDYSQWLRDVKS